VQLPHCEAEFMCDCCMPVLCSCRGLTGSSKGAAGEGLGSVEIVSFMQSTTAESNELTLNSQTPYSACLLLDSGTSSVIKAAA
jgi:hypothetical protein